jgi:hypothetical protein
MHQAPAFPTALDTLNQTLKQLRVLENVLVDEVRAGTIDNRLTPEARLFKELQLGVQVIVPKLQRALAAPLPSDKQLSIPGCERCD